jgi:hypothetical protein
VVAGDGRSLWSPSGQESPDGVVGVSAWAAGEQGERLGTIGVSQTLKRIAGGCDPRLPLPFHAHMLRHSVGFGWRIRGMIRG